MSGLLRVLSTCLVCPPGLRRFDKRHAQAFDLLVLGRFHIQIVVVPPLVVVAERPVTCCLVSVVSIRSKSELWS